MDTGNKMSPHKAAASARLSKLGRKYFHLIEFDDEEELYAEIRKHAFGLLLIEITGVFIISIIALATVVFPLTVLPDMIEADVSSFQPILVTVGLILTLLSFVGLFIASELYRSNVIYVTNEKIAQVIYTSLFSRKLSQLSIGDVQDVSVHQKGIFPRIFNYGTLVIETAGEQQNYTFTYVPKPYENSKIIIGAHETNLKQYGN